MKKEEINTAYNLTKILGLSVMYNQFEHLYVITAPAGKLLIPAGKTQEGIIKFLREYHPEIML